MILYFSGCQGGGEKVEMALPEKVLKNLSVMLSYFLIKKRGKKSRFEEIIKQRKRQK